MNRFEQLIEYVINDEDAKARELFHDIVVAKSREIYENLMQEEAEEDLEEGAEEELDESEEDLDEDAMGGDASDDLIDNIEADEEQDMSMEGEESDAEFDDEAEEAGDDLTGDMETMNDEGGSDPASKDDILNLEDKLDQLMAEFEDLMGSNDMGDDMDDGDGFGPEEGGDAIEMDDTGEMQPGMMEAISLKAAPKPVTSEEGGVNKRSTVAANAGAKGPIGNTVKPVHAGGEMGGRHDSSAYSNQTKDLIGDFQNKAGTSMKNLKPATKPHLAQASGVNTKSPVARS
jgi:hypothetical protein